LAAWKKCLTAGLATFTAFFLGSLEKMSDGRFSHLYRLFFWAVWKKCLMASLATFFGAT